jgi:hypothetical protein
MPTAAKLKAQIPESPSSLTHLCNLVFRLLSQPTHVERQLPDLFVRLDLCKAWHPSKPDAVLDDPEQLPVGHSLHVGRFRSGTRGYIDWPIGAGLRPSTMVTPDQTDRLMARNEWERRFHRPIAVHRMQIGVAYAARLGFHQNLAGPGEGMSNSTSSNGFPNCSTTAACILCAMINSSFQT